MTAEHVPSEMGKTIGLEISLDVITPSSTNPRKIFDEAELEELTLSVRKQGVIQPVVVRALPAGRTGKGRSVSGEYELVAGERRYRAAKAAGLPSIPCVVRELTDLEVLEIQMVENLQRADFHPLDEAEGYRQLMAVGKYDAAKIAGRVGRSVKYVYDRSKLLSLTKTAQQIFRDGKITAGHAILLARLTPSEQARALDHGVFEHERRLFDYGEGTDHESDAIAEKPVSVRELQGWIDEHVKLDVMSQDLPDLFPETTAELARATEEAEKVVSITYDYQIQPDAKDGTRVLGPRSWKRADGKQGSKTCDYALTGVIVVGPGRGAAFRVCTGKKKCGVHWGEEQRTLKERADAAARGGNTGEDRYAIEQRKREEEKRLEAAAQARWVKALPAVLKAVAGAIKAASARSKGVLGDLVAVEVMDNRGWAKREGEFLGRGTSAEDLVRYAAFLILRSEAADWRAYADFPKRAKVLGIDVKKILDSAAPLEAVKKAVIAKSPRARKAKKA